MSCAVTITVLAKDGKKPVTASGTVTVTGDQLNPHPSQLRGPWRPGLGCWTVVTAQEARSNCSTSPATKTSTSAGSVSKETALGTVYHPTVSQTGTVITRNGKMKVMTKITVSAISP